MCDRGTRALQRTHRQRQQALMTERLYYTDARLTEFTARVVDVVDEKERIAHVLEKPARFSPNDELKARVDWTRRFDHMQQHTGQHLLSAVFEELFGHKTVSVHFGDESSTLDLDVASLPKDRALKAERRVNEIVFENRPVTVTFENAASAAGLRKAADRTGEIRVVERRV